MPIPIAFTEAADQKEIQHAAHTFGDSGAVSEDDLIEALEAMKSWPTRFVEPFTFTHRGAVFTSYQHESLTWALGEQFRQIMLRLKPLRRNEHVFRGVRAICRDRRFGKGRESFVMLLGHYGGPAQIPTLIELLDDPIVCGHALYSLRLLAAPQAATKARRLLKSEKTWVRNEARKYFDKIKSTKHKSTRSSPSVPRRPKNKATADTHPTRTQPRLWRRPR